MDGTISLVTIYVLLIVAYIIPVILLMAITKNRSLIPPPKERDFNSALADWARQQGLQFAPQKVNVISGTYQNRWFTIATANEENALQIRMRVENPRRTSLQIFGDWLEDSGVIAFVNRLSVRIFNALADVVSDTLKATFLTFAQFAELHRDIIARFGRFPHRNRLLGRAHTPEEARYLQGDAPTFGQR